MLHVDRLGLKSFFEEGRSLAQISHLGGERAELLPRERTVYMVMNYLEGASPAGLRRSPRVT